MPVPIIEIAVRDRVATHVGEDYYICGNSDYVIHFDFDEEWGALDIKTARFIAEGNILYPDQIFSGSECPMPVISNTTNIRVGVFAGNLQTTTPARVSAVKSILCGTSTPAAPEENAYHQAMEEMAKVATEARTKAAEAAASAEASAQSASAADKSERTTGNYSSIASTQASNAAASASEAATSAANAATSESNAAAGANKAATSAADAATSESAAATSASKAAASAQTAIAQADDAEESAKDAQSWAGRAEAFANNAATRATAAATSASEAAAAAETLRTAKVPNPFALTLTGAVEATYDGSGAVTVEIPEGGGGTVETAEDAEVLQALADIDMMTAVGGDDYVLTDESNNILEW